MSRWLERFSGYKSDASMVQDKESDQAVEQDSPVPSKKGHCAWQDPVI